MQRFPSGASYTSGSGSPRAGRPGAGPRRAATYSGPGGAGPPAPWRDTGSAPFRRPAKVPGGHGYRFKDRRAFAQRVLRGCVLRGQARDVEIIAVVAKVVHDRVLGFRVPLPAQQQALPAPATTPVLSRLSARWDAGLQHARPGSAGQAPAAPIYGRRSRRQDARQQVAAGPAGHRSRRFVRRQQAEAGTARPAAAYGSGHCPPGGSIRKRALPARRQHAEAGTARPTDCIRGGMGVYCPV